MILQHFVMPDPEICGDFRLYLDKDAKGRFPLVMDKGQSLEFRGFVNFFSLTKWKKYADIGNLRVKAEFRGCATVSVLLNKEDGSRIVASETCKDGADLPIPENIRDGLLSVHIKAESDLTVRSGSYVCDGKPKETKLGLNVCTYRRKEYVSKKIDTFLKALEYGGDFENSVGLFITDNASELDPSMAKDERIRLFHNENTGGSRGFSRGIIEIDSVGGFTHVVFMDDDTLVEPECVYRTWAFLSLIKDEYKDCALAGAMLLMDEKNIVYEAGATYYAKDGGIAKSRPRKNMLDVSDVKGCLFYDVEEKTDYGGWWYCVYPTSFANPSNLPLPLFMKYDDVEYGLRHGKDTLILNGVSVWHDDFFDKITPTVEYYNARNHLILEKLLQGRNRKQERKILSDAVSDALCLSYDSAEAKLDAVRDFRSGYTGKYEANTRQNNRYDAEAEPRMEKRRIPGLFWRIVSLNGAHRRYVVSGELKNRSSEYYGVKTHVFDGKVKKRSTVRMLKTALRCLLLYVS